MVQTFFQKMFTNFLPTRFSVICVVSNSLEEIQERMLKKRAGLLLRNRPPRNHLRDYHHPVDLHWKGAKPRRRLGPCAGGFERVVVGLR